jgi:hypothetical protein
LVLEAELSALAVLHWALHQDRAYHSGDFVRLPVTFHLSVNVSAADAVLASHGAATLTSRLAPGVDSVDGVHTSLVHLLSGWLASSRLCVGLNADAVCAPWATMMAPGAGMVLPLPSGTKCMLSAWVSKPGQRVPLFRVGANVYMAAAPSAHSMASPVPQVPPLTAEDDGACSAGMPPAVELPVTPSEPPVPPMPAGGADTTEEATTPCPAATTAEDTADP